MNQNVVSHSKHKHNFTETYFFSYPLKITNALEIFLETYQKIKIQRVYYNKDSCLIFLKSNTLRVEVGYL